MSAGEGGSPPSPRDSIAGGSDAGGEREEEEVAAAVKVEGIAGATEDRCRSSAVPWMGAAMQALL